MLAKLFGWRTYASTRTSYFSGSLSFVYSVFLIHWAVFCFQRFRHDRQSYVSLKVIKSHFYAIKTIRNISKQTMNSFWRLFWIWRT